MATLRRSTPPPPPPPPPRPPLWEKVSWYASTAKLPGWALVALAVLNLIPDYKSRFEFWITLRPEAGWLAGILGSILGSAALTGALAVMGLLYILFVGKPEKYEVRFPILPVVGWVLTVTAGLALGSAFLFLSTDKYAYGLAVDDLPMNVDVMNPSDALEIRVAFRNAVPQAPLQFYMRSYRLTVGNVTLDQKSTGGGTIIASGGTVIYVPTIGLSSKLIAAQPQEFLVRLDYMADYGAPRALTRQATGTAIISLLKTGSTFVPKWTLGPQSDVGIR